MLLAAAVVIFAIVMIAVPPIAQPASYHDFADKRLLVAGIPNTFDVLSNIAFVIAGVFGLIIVRRAEASAGAQVFIAGTFATAIGSTWYHLHPDDNRLVFDRLGMVICFAALVAVLIGKRSLALIAALIVFGTATILWWRYTNDLRAWGFAQFFPMILLFVKRDKTLIEIENPSQLPNPTEIDECSQQTPQQMADYFMNKPSGPNVPAMMQDPNAQPIANPRQEPSTGVMTDALPGPSFCSSW